MAAKLLMPGIGGFYESETFTSSSTIGADTIDASRCAQLIIQVVSASGGGTFQLEQSVTTAAFDQLAGPISFANGTIYNFDVTKGPFGVLRIDATSVTGTGTVVIVGYEMQGGR